MSKQQGVDRDFVGRVIELNKDTLQGRFRCSNGLEFIFTGRLEFDRESLIAMFADPGEVRLGAQAIIPVDEDDPSYEALVERLTEVINSSQSPLLAPSAEV